MAGICIMSEFVEGFEQLFRIHPAVSILVSARTAQEHPSIITKTTALSCHHEKERFCRSYNLMLKYLIPGILTLSLIPAAVLADEATAPPPPQVDADNLEPEVTITETDERTTYEYSINGRRYMVKIVPAKGPAYYLLDLDGDGEMDVQKDDPASIVVPQWVLFRW